MCQASVTMNPQGCGFPRSGAQQAPRRLQASPNPAQGCAGEGYGCGVAPQAQRSLPPWERM